MGQGVAAIHIVLGHMQPAGHGVDMLVEKQEERSEAVSRFLALKYVNLCVCLGVLTKA